MKGDDAPCKDCTKRHARCHAECSIYISFRTKRDAINEAIHMHYVAHDYSIEQALKNVKYQHRHKRK